MGASGGPIVYDGVSAKAQLKSSGYVAVRDGINGSVTVPSVYADVTTDANTGWFLVFVAYPRVTSPYITSAVSSPPSPSTESQAKLADSDIQKILNLGSKQTRTQWWHTSEAYGSVWADGSLNNDSTMYNLFENPSNWNTVDRSGGQRFKRRNGPNSSYGDWITAAGDGCDGPVGGWSNYQQSSCTISWFAGCEGAPAYYHCCACPVDRASQLFVWAA